MNDLMIYLIRSAATLAALYSVYWMFLRKDTFFNVNRYYLLCSVFVSFVLPLLNIEISPGSAVAPVVVFLDPIIITPDRVNALAASHLSLSETLLIIYFSGVCILSIRFLVQLAQLFLIARKYGITRQDGMNLVFVDRSYSPFSFFNLIFIRKEYYINGQLTPVVAHEKEHIRQLHTLDLILVELTVILQWFNPFAWFLGRSVKNLHEFLADEGVLKTGFLKTDYQALILNEAMGVQVNNLTNNFNVSLLKTRITMMTKARTASWALIKVGFALPVLMLVLVLLTSGSLAPAAAQDTPQKTTEKAQKSQQVATETEETIFQEVAQMPTFPGGEDGLIKYLVSSIKYPEEAKKNGIQGKVFVQFVIEKDGAVSNVKVLKGIGSGCDEEAARVISSMPKWSPGKNADKKPVRVMYNIPIMFSLKEKEAPAAPEEKQ